ncbi:MAG: glycerol-3-phosphate 1-O-acyltransferase PlsY [Candidatus Omnitrophica bacterium]|nr:glycerol-3-phosphate 1-O-acyltransferase PlsY [Candidatus Omnitrophota bacterium]
MIVGIVFSYILGSIPTAYILGRLKGIDIRKHGSGNVGATNAFRVLGKTAGISALLIDLLKGLIATMLFANYFNPAGASLFLRILYGFSCVCGHTWSVFLRFKGGKGVASSLGVLAGLAIVEKGLAIVLALVILVWVASFLISRIVSLSSILSALSFPLFVFCFNQVKEIKILSILLCLFIILKHKSNLQRLLKRKEPPLL